MLELTGLAPFIGLMSLIFAFVIYLYIRSEPNGTQLMQEVEGMIHEGAMVFLKREYSVLALFIICAFLLLWFFFKEWYTPVAFMTGALVSIIALYVGMKAAIRGNSRTAEAAKKSVQTQALTISYLSGSVISLSVMGFGLLGLGACLWKLGLDPDSSKYLNGFAMGASSVALFVRIGGGIFTKAVDVGTDLAARIEAGIPQDDPRNPGVIADNVGDNVGDIAGMGADLLESYVGAIIACIAIGATMTITPEFMEKFPLLKAKGAGTVRALYIALPVLIAVAGHVSSFIGIGSLKAFCRKRPAAALRFTVFLANILFVALSAVIVGIMKMPWGTLWAIFSGVICGMALGLMGEYYTSGSPAYRITEESRNGPGTVIISGLALGMRSTCLPILVISATVFTSYFTAGIFGLGISAVGMLATVGATMTIDAYGSIADNAGSLSDMSGLGIPTRRIIDNLDSMGNTTSATGRSFATGAAVLTTIAFFAAYAQSAKLQFIDIKNPMVIVGIFIGAIIPMLAAGMTITAVGKAANKIVGEIRRQFREIKGLLEGREGVKSDPNSCISIGTTAAIKETIVPGLMGLLSPVAVGFFFGTETLGGMILGAAVMGIFLAFFMSNAGGAWDNAKKYIDSGNFGGKGSENHRAAVVGDMVGDPFKDTSGPAMNTIIKLIAVVSLIIAPILKPAGFILGF